MRPLFGRVTSRAYVRIPYLLAWCLLSVACSRSKVSHKDGFETLELRCEGYANSVSPPELAEDLGYLAPVRLKFMGNNSTGGPHSIQSVASGDLDYGGSFNGAIVKIIASKAQIRSVVAAYGTDGLSYTGFFVLEDSPIRSARDLISKTVAVNTLRAVPAMLVSRADVS